MKKTCILIFLLALLAVSCQQGEIIPATEADNVMLFNVANPNAHTRVAQGVFEAEDKIGIYVTDYLNSTTPAPLQISGNRANNESVIYSGSVWNTERAVYWGTGKSDVYAYYPYIASMTNVDEQPFSVATDQTVDGAYEASDFLWAKAAGVAQTDGAVSLNMKHAMSRLVVKIMAGEEYKGSLPADATVYLHSTVTDALVSLANGAVAKNPYSGAHSIKMRNCGVHTLAEGEAVVYEAIVVPQMIESSVPLLEINSKSVSYLLEDMFNFKPGTSYTYTAVLNSSINAIKVDIGCSTDDWNNIGGGSGGSGGDGSEEGEDDGIDLSLYTDLSTAGTANCYMISAAGNYKFKAVKGNSEYTVGNVKSVKVLWETFGTDVMPNVGDLVATAGYKNGYVYFSTPETFANGNASIAVKNSKGVILWSWHIWCTTEGWNDQVYANNAGTMMDRNLGATSAAPGDIGAFGLLYQWGRKDPFLGSCTISGTTLAASTGTWTTYSTGEGKMDYAEENPTAFVKSNWYGGGVPGNGWHISSEAKGLYDPCPVGYRVPDGGSEGFWKTAYVKATSGGSNKGMYWELADGTTAWYPVAGYRDCSSGVLSYVGSFGYCWSASPSLSTSSNAYLLYFVDFGSVDPEYGISRSYGYSVRCVRE